MAKKAVFRVLVRDGRAIVRPPFDDALAPTAAGTVVADGVTIRNKTTAKIYVKIPDGLFDFDGDKQADPGKIVPIASGGDEPFSLPKNALRGAFPFQVFCEETFSFAQGNSDPEFIID